MRPTTILVAAIALFVGLPAISAPAQQPTATQQLKEIVVTAQKRSESFQKAPVIETVVSADTLNQFAIHGLKTLAQEVPSLQMGSNIMDFGTQVSIRGIGNTTLNATVDQSVALNIDGMQINQGLAYSTGLFDIGQIEVLEGPQDLFYGQSAISGVVSIHTADPTDEPELLVGVGYETEAQEKQYQFIVSGPVTDTLKLRLATQFSNQLGDFTNEAIGIPAEGGLSPQYRDLPDTYQYIVRGTALWTPTENFETRLKLDYSREYDNGDDGDLENTSCPGGTGSFFGLQFLSPADDCHVSHDIYSVDMNPAAFPGIANNGVPFNVVNQLFGTLQETYHSAAKVNITSVTGYYHLWDQNLFNGTGTGAAGPLFDFDNALYIHDVSEELRAYSDFDGPLNFTAGGYYENGNTRQWLLGTYNQFLGLPLPALFQDGYFTVPSKTYSGFGELRYKILPQLELAAGARWIHYATDITEVSQSAASTDPGIGVPVGVIATGVPNVTSEYLDPSATLTYTPTDDVTVFGSFKEASQNGGFQTTIIQPAGTNLSFGPETTKGGEVGIKTFLLDRRANVDLSAYDYEYSNLQVGENLTTAQGLIVRTINAGQARNTGLELSVRYLPLVVDGLMLRANVDYDHARFGRFLNAPCWGGQTIAAGCNQGFDSYTGLYTTQNLTGQPLVRAPDWTMNFGFDYERPVGNNMSLTFGSNTYYSSSYYTDLAERSDMVQGAFFKTNASISLGGQDDVWQVSLVGVNLADVLTTGYCANSTYQSSDLAADFGLQTTGGNVGGEPDGLACAIDRGREVWIQLQFKPHL